MRKETALGGVLCVQHNIGIYIMESTQGKDGKRVLRYASMIIDFYCIFSDPGHGIITLFYR